MKMAKFQAKLEGTGHYVPDEVITNSYFEKFLDTSDEWISSMTGMKERRRVAKNQATSDIASAAARKAIKDAGLSAADIDLILVATVTPDYSFPATACLVQRKLGIEKAAAMDISAGCTGFIYASDMARAYIEAGFHKRVLVIGAETLTRISNYQDRNTCVLFGDGAGACIYSRADLDDTSRFIGSYLEASGKDAELLLQAAGGSRLPASKETVAKNLHTIQMDGNKVFKLAIKSMFGVCKELADRTGITFADIDFLVPHQANLRIIEGLGKKMKIDAEKVVVNIDKYGNTSAATVPMAFDSALQEGKIKKGDLVMMTAFGAGLTSGAMLLRV